MYKIVLVRHGQSEWNKENLFTGWTDVPLSELGEVEAKEAGLKIQKANLEFTLAYTSVLKRAIKTCWLILEESNQMYIPVIRSWKLNERHYGALQGKNKKQTADQYGEEQLKLWRRSYTTYPPLLEENDEDYLKSKEHYKKIGVDSPPRGESLEATVERLVPYWRDEISPKIKQGEKILIAAHGNSLRALIKHIADISDEEIVKLEIPTGKPLVYELDENLKATHHYYLE